MPEVVEEQAAAEEVPEKKAQRKLPAKKAPAAKRTQKKLP